MFATPRQLGHAHVLLDISALAGQGHWCLDPESQPATEITLQNGILPSLRDMGTGLRHIRILHIPCCSVSSLDGFNCLPFLEELYAAFNEVAVLEPLMDAEHLTILDLEANLVDELDQIDFLNACEGLVCLCLHGNPVCTQLSYSSFTSKLIVEAMDTYNARGQTQEWPNVASHLGSLMRDLQAEGHSLDVLIADLAVDAAVPEMGLGSSSAFQKQQDCQNNFAVQPQIEGTIENSSTSNEVRKQAQPWTQTSMQETCNSLHVTSSKGGLTAAGCSNPNLHCQQLSRPQQAAANVGSTVEDMSVQTHDKEAELQLVLKSLRNRVLHKKRAATVRSHGAGRRADESPTGSKFVTTQVLECQHGNPWTNEEYLAQTQTCSSNVCTSEASIEDPGRSTPATSTDSPCMANQHVAAAHASAGANRSSSVFGSLPQPHRGTAGHMRTIAMLAQKHAVEVASQAHSTSAPTSSSSAASQRPQSATSFCCIKFNWDSQNARPSALRPQTSFAAERNSHELHACTLGQNDTCGDQGARLSGFHTSGRSSSRVRLASAGSEGMAGGAASALRRRGQSSGMLQEMLHLRARLVATLMKIDSTSTVLTDEAVLASLSQCHP